VRYAAPNTSHHEWQDIPAMPHPPNWTTDAACITHYPDLWYPDQGGSTRDAKQICARCPVQLECLQYALDHDERFGVWGGLSERERRRLTGGWRTVPCIICDQPTPIPPGRGGNRFCCSESCRRQARQATKAAHDAKKRVA